MRNPKKVGFFRVKVNPNQDPPYKNSSPERSTLNPTITPYGSNPKTLQGRNNLVLIFRVVVM